MTASPSAVYDGVQLLRDTHGRLVLVLADGSRHAAVVPVRAFPIAAPQQGLSLMATDGKEVLWVPRMDGLPEPMRALIEQDLAVREFMPTVHKITAVSGYSTPSTWQVETDRGPTELVLKAEEDIRRLDKRTHLLIADHSGVLFHIPDSSALDRASRKLLERFL